MQRHVALIVRVYDINLRQFSFIYSSSPKKSIKKPKENEKVAKESKKMSKQRSTDRRHKLDAQNSDIDLGHVETSEGIPPLLIPPVEGSLSRSSSDHASSLLYGKTLHPRNGILIAKSSSLVFPTGVKATVEEEELP